MNPIHEELYKSDDDKNDHEISIQKTYNFDVDLRRHDCDDQLINVDNFYLQVIDQEGDDKNYLQLISQRDGDKEYLKIRGDVTVDIQETGNDDVGKPIDDENYYQKTGNNCDVQRGDNNVYNHLINYDNVYLQTIGPDNEDRSYLQLNDDSIDHQAAEIDHQSIGTDHQVTGNDCLESINHCKLGVIITKILLRSLTIIIIH